MIQIQQSNPTVRNVEVYRVKWILDRRVVESFFALPVEAIIAHIGARRVVHIKNWNGEDVM